MYEDWRQSLFDLMANHRVRLEVDGEELDEVCVVLQTSLHGVGPLVEVACVWAETLDEAMDEALAKAWEWDKQKKETTK